MEYVTWAEVIPEDKELLLEVGQQLWENLMNEKKIVHVEFVAEEG